LEAELLRVEPPSPVEVLGRQSGSDATALKAAVGQARLSEPLAGRRSGWAVGVDDPKSQVGSELRHHHLGAFQLDAVGEVVEQRDAGTQNDRRDVEVDAVDQSGVERLLDHAGAAHDVDLLLIGCGRARATACSMPSVTKVRPCVPSPPRRAGDG
jgi:hypothetical protein